MDGSDESQPRAVEEADTLDAPASIGPAALKAFAHPLRMRLFSELTRLGSATASELGRRLGESSGQTSYHLRQLATHGFVEDDPGHEGGRERWWRPVAFDLSVEHLDDPDSVEAVREVLRNAVAERTVELTRWMEHQAKVLPEDAGWLESGTLSITKAEAEHLSDELQAVLRRHAALTKARPRPDDAERFRVHIDVFPLGD